MPAEFRIWTQISAPASGQKFSVALVDERGKRAKAADVEMVIDPKFARAEGKRR